MVWCVKMVVELFPHQRSAIERMRALETNDIHTSDCTTIRTSLGLYTEKPGAGKSYAMLAHLLATPYVCSTTMDDPRSYTNERLRFFTSQTRTLCGTRVSETVYPLWNATHILPINLVLVPNSTYSQWITYVRNLVGENDPRIKTCQRITSGGWTKLINGSDLQTIPQILIVDTNAYSSIMRFQSISRFVFQRLIIDEADSIKVSNFRILDSLFMWIITATPQTLSTSSCRSLNIRRMFFDSGRGTWESESMRLIRAHIQIRHEDEIIDAALRLPPPRTRTVSVMISPLFRGIRSFLTPLALSALDACDHQGAMTALGCSSARGDDGIISALVSKLEREVDELRQQLMLEEEVNNHDVTGIITDLYARIARRRDMIQNIMQRVREGDCCPIGLDTIENKAVTPCCQNAFEFTNLVRALSRSSLCPLCKSYIHTSQLVVSLNNCDDGHSRDREVVESHVSKEDALRSELAKALRYRPDTRILIFSCFWSFNVNKVVHEVCTETGVISYVARACDKAIPVNALDDFKTGSTRVMVLNAHSVGAGVNLESTTHVFTMHKMRDDLYTQVIGRAQRMGRRDTLDVINIRYDGE